MARVKKTKSNVSELAGQTDPRAPLDSTGLLSACQVVLARLETDLLERARSSAEVTRALEVRYRAEKAAERTAESFAGWAELLATQVAAAWVLSCVFVRTLEDRGLLRQARLAGVGAEDSQRQFFQLAPSLTERDYLLTVFRELARHPAAAALFDAEHSPVWRLSPSAEAAKELLALFRMPNATTPAFRFGQTSTRFLGDLYQDLSEEVRKRYALLQTPDFIEAFILDRTLEPAIARFGLDDTTLIDPTCGSGHFLLGAFDRLFAHRLRSEPGIDPRVAAIKALDCVYGADINPYAVAIARFRLTLSFLEKAGYAKLADAPKIPLHLVVADSLRINPQHSQQELWQHAGATAGQWLGDVFAFDDEHGATDVLGREYAAVVGNPPYITVKDAALRETYRAMYPRSAAGKYSLSAPFCERFFQLSRPRGYVGQITANSFMKREFGRNLIETFLPTVNLELIVNTAGAFIPGHGTPTILLFGSREEPQGGSVVVVLGSRGEPSTPPDPARGEVWMSIANHYNEVGFENDYVSVARLSRDILQSHPWSLGGGQAAELKEMLESIATTTLREIADAIGFDAIMGEETLFTGSPDWFRRLRIDSSHVRSLCEGECVRDWTADTRELAIFPYSEELLPTLPSESVQVRSHFWNYRSLLEQRSQFGKTTLEAGLKWFEYRSFYKSKRSTPLSIVFSAVASHNHFILDRGGRVFKQSAPLIKLHAQASEEDYLALLAYLNSSTACFYMRQVSHQKQMMGGESIRHTDPTTVTFDFSGGSVASLPLPPWTDEQRSKFIGIARQMESLVSELASLQPTALINRETVTRGLIEDADLQCQRIRAEMVGLQEWLDWFTYEVFRLHDHADALGKASPTRPGLRAFEVLKLESGHTETIDGHVIGTVLEASALDSTVPARIACIRANPNIKELEQSQFKRRWIGRQGKFNKKESTFGTDVISAIETRLLDVCESALTEPATVGGRGLADLADRCGLATSSCQWLFDELGINRTSLLRELMEKNSAPFLNSMLFSDSGLALAREWERVWELQRRQDVGESIRIQVPDTFEPRDYRRSQWQAVRGKRNVPAERFISYPFCESDDDDGPVYGWAGWDHVQRATALWQLYVQRRDQDGWTTDRLTPMLAGLLELIPSVKQWHNEPSEEYGGLRMGDNFADVLEGECRRHGLTHDDLRAWRPPKKGRGSKTATKIQRDLDSAGEDEREQGLVSDKHPTKKRARRNGTGPASGQTEWVASIEAQQVAFLKVRGAKFHDRGDRSYVMTVEDNVLALSVETRGELDGGSGNELGTEDRPGKVLAPWSSSALAVNVFEHWRHRDTKPVVRALGSSGPFPIVRFEAQFSTGLRGGRANLDVLLEDKTGRRIAIESKFLEPYRGSSSGNEDPVFSAAYFADPRLWIGIEGLQALAKGIVEGTTRFARLDAPQLVKHILALRHASKPFELVHLWYRPDNNLPEVKVIEQEIAAFRAITDRDDVRFRSMTYQELFARLCVEAPEQVEYLGYLRNRYFTTSTTSENP